MDKKIDTTKSEAVVTVHDKDQIRVMYVTSAVAKQTVNAIKSGFGSVDLAAQLRSKIAHAIGKDNYSDAFWWADVLVKVAHASATENRAATPNKSQQQADSDFIAQTIVSASVKADDQPPILLGR